MEDKTNKVEENTLNPQESLRMIEKMIEGTRKRLIRGSGRPSLIWGYVTVLTSLLIYFVIPAMGWRAAYLWLLIPLVGNVLMFLDRKNRYRTVYVRTQIDRITDIVWLVIGLNVLVLGLITYKVYTLPILSLVLICIGMATAITAFAFRIPVLKGSSIFGMIVGYLLLLLPVDGRTSILIFGLTFFVMHCLPGHYLLYLDRKSQPDA